MKVTIFIGYAHQDEAFGDQLTSSSKVCSGRALIAPWHDRCIDGGDDCVSGITEAIDTCIPGPAPREPGLRCL